MATTPKDAPPPATTVRATGCVVITGAVATTGGGVTTGGTTLARADNITLEDTTEPAALLTTTA